MDDVRRHVVTSGSSWALTSHAVWSSEQGSACTASGLDVAASAAKATTLPGERLHRPHVGGERGRVAMGEALEAASVRERYGVTTPLRVVTP